MTGPRKHRVAWLHCFSGIAGDMALGALIDAGADLVELQGFLDRLPIGGWALETSTVLRAGISAMRVEVRVHDDGVERSLPTVLSIIEAARLPDRARDRAIATFTALAQVEARIHHRLPAQVHFHELGAHDAIIDIVGTACALELLGVDELWSSPIATGRGMVRSRHGLLPNPAPAVIALLNGAPVYGRDVDVELTTPTGAALVATLASGYGPLPAMTVEATGYGAGARDTDGLPNCVQVVIGLNSAASGTQHNALSGQPLVLLETNLDDVTGEQLADTLQALLAGGALDAWLTPVIMKKGRPGHVISALCDTALTEQLCEILRAETGTFGVRAHVVDRFASARRIDEVTIGDHVVRVKVSPHRAKVEHDDALRVARESDLPVRAVIASTEQAWKERTDTGGTDGSGAA